MEAANIVHFETPKGVHLHGLWHGSKKAERVVVLVHGMAGSLFSLSGVVAELAKGSTAVLTFNNRGHDIVSSIKRTSGKRIRYTTAGTAHEIFEECVDDIQGAIRFVRSEGERDVYLAGHSTGAQKIVYWYGKSKDRRGVRGMILLGPLSDYAEARAANQKQIERGALKARALVKKKMPHELMPESLLPSGFPLDAQRYLSLYTAQSREELFPYWQSGRSPRALRAIEMPMLVLLAEKDEYGNYPPETLAEWFTEHIYTGEATVVPETGHSFKGAEKTVAKTIDSFMKERYN